MIGWLLLACAPPNLSGASPSGDPVVVRVALDGALQKRGGALLLQVEYDPAGAVEIPSPAAQGVTFTPDGEPRVERIGGRDVVTQRYVFEAASGSYEVAPVPVAWTGPDGAVVTGASGALFVDLGVPPPRPAEIADIVDPDRVRTTPWLVGGVVAALVAGGLWVAFRPRRAPAIVAKPAPPPDVVALKEWDAVRADATLPLEQKAVRLAGLFRVYVEAVLGFEATARTTPEIVAHLESLRHLPDGNPLRAKRLLRATDRVKFAEEQPVGADGADPVEAWLGELDADLRSFVASTRPVVARAVPRRSA